MSDTKYEEMDKEEKIALFKAMTPLGILKSFRDEDEIWDFITTSNEWAPDPEIVKKYSGKIVEEIEKERSENNSEPDEDYLDEEFRDAIRKQVTIDTTEKDPEKLKEQIKDMVQKAADSIIKEE